MERCPNCGQQSRVGAKFCTTCGYRMPESESYADTEPPSGEPAQVASDTVGEHAQDTGWPEPSAPAEPAPRSAWAPSPAQTNATATNLTTGEANMESPTSFWSPGSENTWPARSSTGPDPSLPADELESATPREEPVTDDFTATPQDNEADTAATDRVARLLDELREAISALQGQPPVDLSPVIADLEVAVTPPGAVNPEKLNELRDALLSAREKPRDIDTIVTLTGQLDSLVALIFAYDRTIAAIERSLEVLRRA